MQHGTFLRCCEEASKGRSASTGASTRHRWGPRRNRKLILPPLDFLRCSSRVHYAHSCGLGATQGRRLRWSTQLRDGHCDGE